MTALISNLLEFCSHLISPKIDIAIPASNVRVCDIVSPSLSRIWKGEFHSSLIVSFVEEFYRYRAPWLNLQLDTNYTQNPDFFENTLKANQHTL